MHEIGSLALRFGLILALFGLGAGIYAGVAKRPDWTRRLATSA